MSQHAPATPPPSPGATIPPPSRPPPTLSRLELHYSEKPASMSDIVKDLQLPRVVRCDPATVPSMSLPLDISQPLLVFAKRSVRKVGARSVLYDRTQGRYMDAGDDILVPEDYMGLFGVLGSPSEVKVEGNIPHFRNVSRLAISACNKFLVGGATFVKAFLRMPGRWESHKIFPGDVLTKGEILQERQEFHNAGKKKKEKGKKKLASSKKEKPSNVIVATDLYLRCYDSQGRELLLQGEQEGVFYILSQNGAPVRTPVLCMADILQRYKFPLLVKLLYGTIPLTPCSFRDSLLLTEAGMSHTVVASTLGNIRNINLEVPIDTGMMFFVAEQTSSLTLSRQYRQALLECNAKASSYMRNMKVLLGADLEDEFLPPSDCPSDNSTPDSQPAEKTCANDEGTPTFRQHSNSGDYRRASRLSVISRVITVNSEEQSIFAPTVLKSPHTPQSPQNKRPSFKPKQSDRDRNKDKNTIPENLDPIKDYVPPKAPEVIPSVQLPRALSEEGQKKRINFEMNREKKHEYETPNLIVFEPEEDSFDPSVYGSVWNSSSTESNRESAAGIRIDGKAGRPMNPSQIAAQTISSISENNLPTNSDRLNSLTLSLSLDTSLDSTAHDDSPNSSASVRAPDLLPNSQQGHTPQSPLSSSHTTNFIADGMPPPPLIPLPATPDRAHLSPMLASPVTTSHEENGPPLDLPPYDNEHLQLMTSDTPAQPDSNNPQSQAYHSAFETTEYPDHVYNDLVEVPQYENEDQQARPSGVGSAYPLSAPHVGGQTNLTVGYLAPIDIHTASTDTNQSHLLSNPYVEPTDPWHVTPIAKDGYAFYEISNPENAASLTTPKRIDSGIYEGEDLPGLPPVEDHYDRPLASASQSLKRTSEQDPIYDSPISLSSPNFMMGELEQKLKDIKGVKTLSASSLNDTTPSESTRAFTPPLARPSYLNIEHPAAQPLLPPPVPENHPLRPAKNTSVVDLLKRIPGALPDKPYAKSSNKDLLIAELRKTGLKTSSEIAILGLAAADVAMLASRGDDLDDMLVALLPKVGQVDLRKIAMCIKSLGIRLVND